MLSMCTVCMPGDKNFTESDFLVISKILTSVLVFSHVEKIWKSRNRFDFFYILKTLVNIFEITKKSDSAGQWNSYHQRHSNTKSKTFFVFFFWNFCSKKFSTAPLTLGFSQLISVGQKSSVTNSGVKRVIFETFTFFFAQRYSMGIQH